MIIGFGSNLGNRRKNIAAAFALLSQRAKIIKISSLIESVPAEGVSGDQFLNGAALIETNLKPGALLKLLQEVEKEIGRPRRHRTKEARVIDLDIIYYEDRVINKTGLKVPHPCRLKRPFVMKPAAEVAPDYCDPVLKKTLGAIASEMETLFR